MLASVMLEDLEKESESRGECHLSRVWTTMMHDQRSVLLWGSRSIALAPQRCTRGAPHVLTPTCLLFHGALLWNIWNMI